nr:hypothetical protein 1 [Virus sp.]
MNSEQGQVKVASQKFAKLFSRLMWWATWLHRAMWLGIVVVLANCPPVIQFGSCAYTFLVAFFRVTGFVIEKARRAAVPETRAERYLRYANEYMAEVKILRESVQEHLVDYGVIILVVVSMAIITRQVLKLIVPRCVRCFQRARGIEFVGEAMMAGSEFTHAGSCPKGQIAIMRPGVLSDSHVGFGVRVGDVLLTPLHVLTALDSPSMVLCYEGRKIALPYGHMTCSRFFPDLAYIKYDIDVWAKLGAPRCSVATRIDKVSPNVTCTGQDKKQSSGLLRKSDRPGMFVYGGSTVPGMSGAGYYFGNQLLGIHDGRQGPHNVGMSIVAAIEEMKTIFCGESSEDLTLDIDDVARRGFRKQGWNEEDIAEYVRRAWREDDDYVQRLSYATHLGRQGEAAKRKSKPVSFRLTGTDIPITVPTGDTIVRAESDRDIWFDVAEFENNLASTCEEIVAVDGDYAIGHAGDRQPVVGLPKRISTAEEERAEPVEENVTVEDRLALLEETVAELVRINLGQQLVGEAASTRRQSIVKKTEQVPARKRYVCPCCGATCRTAVRLRRHQRYSCPVAAQKESVGGEANPHRVEGESAIPHDNIKMVASTPFLEKRQSLDAKPSTSSGKTSHTKDRSSNYRAPAESPSGTRRFLRDTLSDLKKQHPRTLGRVSDKPRN